MMIAEPAFQFLPQTIGDNLLPFLSDLCSIFCSQPRPNAVLFYLDKLLQERQRRRRRRCHCRRSSCYHNKLFTMAPPKNLLIFHYRPSYLLTDLKQESEVWKMVVDAHYKMH